MRDTQRNPFSRIFGAIICGILIVLFGELVENFKQKPCQEFPGKLHVKSFKELLELSFGKFKDEVSQESSFNNSWRNLLMSFDIA